MAKPYGAYKLEDHEEALAWLRDTQHQGSWINMRAFLNKTVGRFPYDHRLVTQAEQDLEIVDRIMGAE